MNSMPPLTADGQQLATFFDATFRYADEDGFISLRSFFEDENKTFAIDTHPLRLPRDRIVGLVEQFANRSARVGRPTVCAPIIGTFSNGDKAREEDLHNGLCLSVECDKHPLAAQTKLEAIIGPATVVVASGGEWTDPDTGEVQDKLHLHWRLSEPTRCHDDHLRLKRARTLATALVGGDASNKPIVHPIRWPGSWHRKGTPRLTRIVGLTDYEIDLQDALETLEETAEAAGCNRAFRPSSSAGGLSASGEERETAELIQDVLTGADYHAALVALALRMLLAGMPDGQAVLVLRGVMLAVPDAVRDMKDGSLQPGRWQSRYDDIPRAVSTARTKVGGTTKEAPQGAQTATEETVWGEPVDFFADTHHEAPTLEPGHVPAVIWAFASDTADRLGVDPFSVALAALVSCASVISDDWEVQPKRFDTSWTEQPRIWGAILGEPSVLKTPVISAATKPIDRLEVEARRTHAEAMREWQAAFDVAKVDKVPFTTPQPKLDRFLVEGATPEALSEVLRDDDDAKMRAPAGKVLSRHDEMSEFFGGLDRYKAGGKGGSERGTYLRLYNGGRYQVDRIGRGSFAVPNWSACFLGGCQPGPIQRIATEAADDGLLQRFIYSVPGYQREGVDRAPDRQACERYAALFPALAAFKPPMNFGASRPRPIVFAEAAHQHREHIDGLASAMMALPDISPRLKAAFGKWRGLFARLSLIFHVVGIVGTQLSGDADAIVDVIQEPTAQSVSELMEHVILPHLLRAEAIMFSTDQTGHARWIAGYILAHRKDILEKRDIVRDYRALSSPEKSRELLSVMEGLTALGWLEPETPANPAKSVTKWAVNPAVHSRYADRAQAEAKRRQEARDDIAEAAAARRREKQSRRKAA